VARGNRDRPGEAPSGSGPRKGRKVFAGKRKSCFFCKEKIGEIDYKSIGLLRRSVSDTGKIRGRSNTGTCRRHQKQVAVAIKRAREMALLPYVAEATERPTRSRTRSSE
jgi:small subunit ribosomal protein S18